MPFIGKNPTSGFSTIVKDDLTPDGSTTAFTLSKNVASANDIAVFVGNVRQEPTDAYSVSGTTLTMTAAPSSGVNFYVLHIAGTIESSVVPAAGTTVPGAFGVQGALTSGAIAASGNISTTSNKISITNSSYPQLQINGSTKNWSLFADAGGPLYIKNATDNSNSVLIHPTGGVSFNGDTSSVNVLDDYEEGTFTPTMYGSSGGTPVNGSGFYTKIGNIVKTTIVFASVNMSTGGHSGALRVGGLPFASANQQEVAAAPMTSNVAITGTDKYNIGYISDNSTLITYYRIRDLNTWTGTPVPTGSSVYLYSTFTYTTSA